MVQAVTLHTVQTLAVPGVIDERTGKVIRPAQVHVHQPGAVIELPRLLFDELEAEGAVVTASVDDLRRWEDAGQPIAVIPVPDDVPAVRYEGSL